MTEPVVPEQEKRPTLDELANMYADYRELAQIDRSLVRAFAHWLTLPGAKVAEPQ